MLRWKSTAPTRSPQSNSQGAKSPLLFAWYNYKQTFLRRRKCAALSHLGGCDEDCSLIRERHPGDNLRLGEGNRAVDQTVAHGQGRHQPHARKRSYGAKLQRDKHPYLVARDRSERLADVRLHDLPASTR